MKKVFVDLSGQKFGQLLVLRRASIPEHIKNKSGAYFLCQCDCGKQTIVAANCLKNGNTKTCGCSKINDITGIRFEKLLVIERAPKPNTRSDRSHDSFWLCRCDCGEEVVLASSDLRKNISCGCSRRINSPEEARLSTIKYIYEHRYVDGDILIDDFISLSQLPCYYCGEPPKREFNLHSLKKGSAAVAIKYGSFTYNGLDRVNQNLPHNKDNVVPCCAICNWMKTDHTSEEFIAQVCKIYNNIKGQQ